MVNELTESKCPTHSPPNASDSQKRRSTGKVEKTPNQTGLETLPETVPQFGIEREKNLRRKIGYDYLLITLDFERGKKFGVEIVHIQNHVLVNKVEKDSMCSGRLQGLDRICDVDGIPVTDTNFCKKQIIKGFKQSALSKGEKRNEKQVFVSEQLETVQIDMDNEIFREELEKVLEKTYETSLARLQNEKKNGADSSSK
ncbi:hypothetical protein KIN20_004175 [Parelaphostrongylus tenuis]|uniref:PDZ domain-containing protein n=1 Tax=Parelaphostrongylus tenuis TaxID=148309 RepID=A0AAD5M2N4_PARTN|nr:hypothetical protein KIN20_004175 [Parelaphostrongylus tenuis]